MTNMPRQEKARLLENCYREHGPAVMRYLVRRVARQQAEDMFQDVFAAAARHTDRLAAVDSPRAWLLRVAHNLLCTYYRNRRYLSEIRENIVAVEFQSDFEDLEQMRLAIAALPDESREIILLRWYDQLSYEEMAQVLEIPVGTVRSRLHNSVKKLRMIMLPKENISSKKR